MSERVAKSAITKNAVSAVEDRTKSVIAKGAAAAAIAKNIVVQISIEFVPSSPLQRCNCAAVPPGNATSIPVAR